MKRKIFGGLAILSAAMLPFSGIASAASVVDYEKRIGQVDGADTINWVVEATDDGGYVVGGQTMACYKTTYTGVVEPSGLSGADLGGNGALSAAMREKVDFQECLSHDTGGALGATQDSTSATFLEKLGQSKIMEICSTYYGEPMALGMKLQGDEEVEYSLTCVDYIAKFKVNGAQEWLTTIEDGKRPIAVKKIGDGYRLLTSRGTVYSFSNTGVRKNGVVETEYSYLVKAHFNSDGTIIAIVGRYVDSTEGHLCVFDTDGTIEVDASSASKKHFYELLPAGKDRYIGGYEYREGETIENRIEILTGYMEDTLHPLHDALSDGAYLISANKEGDAAVIATEDGALRLISYDLNGKKLGDRIITEAEMTMPLSGEKDFTIVYMDGDMNNPNDVLPVSKIIKYNRDLSVKYEYTGTGYEYIADVAELNDGSIAGAGVAVAANPNMPVTGGANGGYLRLVAQNNNEPSATNRPDVKNPKTWDAVDTVAAIGGIALLGFGVFLRRNMSRR
ncbi:hypothetical protein J6X15_00320 [Candidatus Saccharibacteria bacterium]|nr:hypothetical protein [Candidatus Saccharibacteria bacterium]